jgi:hypothetical protein
LLNRYPDRAFVREASATEEGELAAERTPYIVVSNFGGPAALELVLGRPVTLRPLLSVGFALLGSPEKLI